MFVQGLSGTSELKRSSRIFFIPIYSPNNSFNMKEKLMKTSYIAPSVRVLQAAVEDGFGLSLRPDVPNANPSSAGTTLLGSGSWD